MERYCGKIAALSKRFFSLFSRLYFQFFAINVMIKHSRNQIIDERSIRAFLAIDYYG